jgi:hypothetical protein
MRLFAAIALGLGASACALLVGIGEHSLRDDADASDTDSAADAPIADVATDTTSEASDDGAPSDAAPEADAAEVGPAIELANGQQSPSHIKSDTTQVYWINEAAGGKPGAIMAMSRDGGAPYALAPNRQKPSDLSLDSVWVYFTDDYVDGGTYGLFRVPRTGGAVDVVDAEDGGLGYAALDTSASAACSEAYAVDGTGARVRCSSKNPPQTGACYPYTQPAAGARLPTVAADATYVYAFDTTANAIVRATIADCSGASATTFSANVPGVRHLGFHGNFMDWVTATDVYNQLRSNVGGSPNHFATGFVGLVWTVGFLSSGQILVDETAGTVTYVRSVSFKQRLADGQAAPSSADTDSLGTVFWTNRASGQIMMHPP